MTTPPLQLAFCDGAFDFDCPSCNALCCRGGGFAGSMQREVPRLLALYPALGSLAVARQGDVVYFANPTNGCYFLDADRLCRVEKEHGRALKPGVCGLFPFNWLLRVGDVIVIRPHFMCPLRAVIPARPGEVEGTHARVAALAAESGLLGASFIEVHLPRVALHPSADATATLAREAAFRDRTAAALGRARFLEVLRAASRDGAAFDAQLGRAAALLGLDPAALSGPRDAVDDLCLLLAAPLRTTMLRLSAEGMLCALALGALVFRRAVGLGAAPTLSGAWELHTRVGPALRLLGRLDEPIVPDPAAPPRIPSFSDPAMALAAGVALRAQPGAGTLAALERAIAPATPTADRSVLLCTLGTVIEGSS